MGELEYAWIGAAVAIILLLIIFALVARDKNEEN
jgi:hypothetical protein